MRCEGADNPPCRRCRNTGLECLFEKPSREATLTGEAGLEFVFPLFFPLAQSSPFFTGAFAVWRTTLLKSAERRQLYQKNYRKFFNMFAVEVSFLLDRHQHSLLIRHQV